MIKIASILAATSLVAALSTAPAEAHWFGGGFGGFHPGYHHFHREHWGYWHRPWGYRVVYAAGVCPPGMHLGYWGHYCRPNF